MLIFGAGISTDVDNLSIAFFDRDHTPESRANPRCCWDEATKHRLLGVAG
jgi:hypothetical protein